MGNFFSMDNKFFTFMSRVADLIILNVIFMLCCIPVITIGPAVTALYYTTLKMVRNEESYIVRGFFHSFRQNFKQGVIINLILLIGGGILFVDLTAVRSYGGTLGKVMFVIFLVMLAFYLMLYMYTYPVLAKFYNTIRNTFRNAILMAIRHLPYTLLMMVIMVLPVLIFWYVPSAQIQSLVLMLYMLMGFSLVAFCKSFFLVKIFDNYIPAEDSSENTFPDDDPQNPRP